MLKPFFFGGAAFLGFSPFTPYIETLSLSRTRPQALTFQKNQHRPLDFPAIIVWEEVGNRRQDYLWIDHCLRVT